MARQERTSQDRNDSAGSADRSSEPTAAGGNRSAVGEPGVTDVRTSDPNIIGSPQPSGQPERAVSYQTSQLSSPPADYPFGAGGGVERGPERANGKKDAGPQQHNQHEKKHHHKDHDDHHGHRDDRHGPRHKKHKKQEVASSLPRWPALVITAVLALVCGVGGAWGYSALFGASSSDHQDKGGSSKKGGKSGGEKSGGSDSDQSSDTDQLKKQVGQLGDGMDELGTRIDRLNQAIQESRMPMPQYYPGTSRIERMAPSNGEAPLVPHALQTQLTVLQRKVEQMTDLRGRVEELERRVTELQEAIKLLVESHATN